MRHTPDSSTSSPRSWSDRPGRRLEAGIAGLPARAALALIRAYKLVLSPWFAGACRFTPGCADYTAEALTRYGLVRGGWLAARRMARCHPFGGHGYDPVPIDRWPTHAADRTSGSRAFRTDNSRSSLGWQRQRRQIAHTRPILPIGGRVGPAAIDDCPGELRG